MMDKIREIPAQILGQAANAKYSVNMNEIVGTHDILFVCLDTLRYDVAFEQQEKNNTPNLNRYGKWEKRHAPGNFTFPSHTAMFAGFLPTPAQPTPKLEMERLFIPRDTTANRPTPKEAFLFEGASFVEGLEKVGYETICVGGVNFFNKRTELGRVLPRLFKRSYWHPSFSCHIKNSFENQLGFIERKLGKYNKDKRIFLYLNIDSIHYPNYFYVDGAKEDSIHTHAAALQYVDSHIERLFHLFRERGKTFVIACSDHGSCYGEDGYHFHRLSHEIVYTVPYKHFVL